MRKTKTKKNQPRLFGTGDIDPHYITYFEQEWLRFNQKYKASEAVRIFDYRKLRSEPSQDEDAN